MEVGSHGIESLNVKREPDRVSMNFNPEIQHYLSQSGSPVVTTTAPIDATGPRLSVVDVGSVNAVVSEPISTAGSSADSFTFPSVTNDLKLASLESQCPAFRSVRPYPADPTIPEGSEGVQNFEMPKEDRSAELPTADFQPAVVGQTSEEQFDDMVVLEDGTVTAATVVTENVAPVKEGTGEDYACTDLPTSTEDAEDTQLPDAPIQLLENAPVEGPFINEVPLQFPKSNEPETKEYPDTDEEIPETEEIPDTDGHPIEVLPEKEQLDPAVAFETTVQGFPSKQLTTNEEDDLETEHIIDEHQGEVTGDVDAPKLETLPSRDEQSEGDTGDVEVSEQETGPVIVDQLGEATADVKVLELETGSLTGNQVDENSSVEKVPKLETLPLIGEQLGEETGDVVAPKLETETLPHKQSIQSTDDIEVPGSALPAEKVPEVTESEQVQPSAFHAGKLPEGTEAEHIQPSTVYSEKIPESTETKEKQLKEDVAKSEIPEKDAEALKGRKVLKKFGKRKFTGDIVGYDPNSRWFKVVYEDGDEEELEWAEIEPILVDHGAAPETVSKKRSRSGDADDEGHHRTPKKVKKSVAATPKKRGKSPDLKKQKTSTSGRKKGKGSKSPGISTKSPGSKGKALKTKQVKSEKSNLKKAPSSKKKPRKTKGLEQLQAGSTKKSPGKVDQRVKPSELDSQHGKSPLKTQDKEPLKGSQQQRFTTPKSSTVSKTRKDAKKSSARKPQTPGTQKAKKKEPVQEQDVSPKSVAKQKSAKKAPKDSEQQPDITSPKQKAGIKRKADVMQSDSSQGKHIKRGDTGERGGGQALRSKGALSVKVEEESAPSVQKSNALEQGISLVGRMIRKKFGGKFYSGEVASFDKKTKFYKVVYEDGDEEEVEWSDLEQILTVENRADASASKAADKKGTPAKPASQRKTPGGKKKGGKGKI
eukprot:c28344_g1_i1 orf=151-2946(+)